TSCCTSPTKRSRRTKWCWPALCFSRLPPRRVQTLLPAASLLQLNGVRDACCKFLLSQLDPSNCLGIRGFADTHSCSDLLKSAHKYVLQHFVEVSKTEEFMLLPLKQVLDLISSDNLNVPSEEEVYRAVLSWVKHDIDGRRQHLMKCVRLPLLRRDFLMSNVDTELLVRHHSECKDLLIEALKYHLMPEQRGVLSNSRTRPRRCEGASPVLFAVGQCAAAGRHCEAYDTRTDRWHMVASMSTRRARVGVECAGAFIVSLRLETIRSPSPSLQVRRHLGPRHRRVLRSHHQRLAAGGFHGNAAELLGCRGPAWAAVRCWRLRRSVLHSGPAGRPLAEELFLQRVFTHLGLQPLSFLSSAERYDPLTSTWTSIAAMSTRRRYVRVATLDGSLYAVGGYDSSSHLATVEKYDPQSNTWTAIANMLSRRSSAGVAVLDGMLYVAGGNDGSSSLNSIEKYNPRSNKWVAASCMFTRRSSVGVAVLELLNFPPPSSPTLSVSSTSL
uniref:Kelch-like family member 17 n=1 Tax=Salarias fasciatus TaxID=181472 RepID=A0A672G905_SALFA